MSSDSMSLKRSTGSNMWEIVLHRRCRWPSAEILQELAMKMPRLILLIGLFWLTASPSHAGTSIHELTLKGNQCQENPGQSLECENRIGKTLRMAITGIGQTDTAITFMTSDIKGDFYVPIGGLHGCVIVKPTLELINLQHAFDFACISPRTGKVYRTWQECGSGT